MTEWLQPLWDGALVFARENVAWTVTIVFLLGFAESIAFVSLFVPSTFLFLAIGGIHSAAGGEFTHVWIAGAAGAAIGDVLSYWMGRHFKNDVHRVWPFSKMPGLIPQARAMFERWGFWTLIAGKFFGGARPFVPVAAGVMDMPWLVFLMGTITSSILWAGVFLAPGYGIMALPW